MIPRRQCCRQADATAATGEG